MRVAAWLLGLATVAGLVVLAVAGLSAATGILLTAVAVLAMIALGNLIGGRSTPERAPVPPEGPTAAPGPGNSDRRRTDEQSSTEGEAGGGTMEA